MRKLFFIGNVKTSTSVKHKPQSTKNNQYDTPKTHGNEKDLILKSHGSAINIECKNKITDEQNFNMIANSKVIMLSIYIDVFLSLPFFYIYIYKEPREEK